MLNASASEDRPLLWGILKLDEEEERYRKQSIGAKGASVLCVSLCSAHKCNVWCYHRKCVSCIVAPCPPFDLSLPRRFQTNRPQPSS